MKYGFHVSAASKISYVNAIETAREYELTAIQLFAKSPRSWQKSLSKAEDSKAFKQARANSPVSCCVIHSAYLINLGGEGESWNKSINSLLDDLNCADLLGIEYVVAHPGSGQLDQLKKALDQLFKRYRGNAKLLLENTAGGGNKLGADLNDFAQLKKYPISFCIDTCHAFAAGYDLKSKPVEFIDQLAQSIGLECIPVIHFNDSERALASHVDHHANLNQGQLKTALKKFLNDKRLAEKTFIMELPKAYYRENLNQFQQWLRCAART